MKIVDMRGQLPEHPSKRYPTRTLSALKRVVVHHSLTVDIPGNRDIYAFARYHVNEKDWPGIGYTYVIDADGVIYKCHSATVKTYHVGIYNRTSLGVCLVGDFRNSEPTRKQYDSLYELLTTINNAYELQPYHTIGHNELFGYYSKQCPCIDMNMVRMRVS